MKNLKQTFHNKILPDKFMNVTSVISKRKSILCLVVTVFQMLFPALKTPNTKKYTFQILLPMRPFWHSWYTMPKSLCSHRFRHSCDVAVGSPLSVSTDYSFTFMPITFETFQLIVSHLHICVSQHYAYACAVLSHSDIWQSYFSLTSMSQ